jgi:hypothetical protein
MSGFTSRDGGNYGEWKRVRKVCRSWEDEGVELHVSEEGWCRPDVSTVVGRTKGHVTAWIHRAIR